jgi:hypothetical protein
MQKQGLSRHISPYKPSKTRVLCPRSWVLSLADCAGYMAFVVGPVAIEMTLRHPGD